MDSGPRDRCLAIGSTARDAATSPGKENLREHSPTRRKTEEFTRIKCGGPVSICQGPIILPRPTNPWALHLPSPLPRGVTRASEWPPATCPHHLRQLRAAWASQAPPRGLACRIASVQVLRATSAFGATSTFVPRQLRGVCGIKPPLFHDFNNKQIITNSLKIKNKI